MSELLQFILNILTTDSTLLGIVPKNNILTGPVDIAQQQQPQSTSPNALIYPQINLRVISESQRTVPLSTRDTQIQIDIFSNNNQSEVQSIYERIIEILSYQMGQQGSAYVFWQRLGGSVDMYETDRRYWHRVVTYTVWSIKS